jgi:hypothetical protein
MLYTGGMTGRPAFGTAASDSLGLPVDFGFVVFGDDLLDGIATH